MIDPGFVFDKVVELIKTVLEMREATISNKERCHYLCGRLEAIQEILTAPNNVKRLSGIEIPKCLRNLEIAVQNASKFIQKYCLKSKMSQFLDSFNIESDFTALNSRLGDAQQDFGVFLANTIDTHITLPQPPPPTEKTFEKDILQVVDVNPNSLLIIRVNPNYKSEVNLFEKLECSQPNLRVLYRTSIEDTLGLLWSWRTFAAERIRIVTNRTILQDGKENSGGGLELIKKVRGIPNGKFPIMIYTNPTTAAELTQSPIMQQHAPLFVTADPKAFETFSTFSKLLWVDPNPDNDKIGETAVSHGVEVVKLKTTTEGLKFLEENSHLKEFTRNFRMITNRARPSETPGGPFNENAGRDFIKGARDQGFLAPVLIFTSTAALPKVAPLQKEFTRVRTTNDPKEALNFVSMVALPDDPPPLQAHPLFQTPGVSSSAFSPLGSVANMTVPTGSPVVGTASTAKPTGLTVRFIVMSCTKLAPKDLNGSSDPYAVITNGRSVVKTPTIMSTLNPVWNQGISDLEGCQLSDTLIFDVYDWDAWGKDDFEGRCQFSLSAFASKLNTKIEMTMPLTQKPGEKGKVTGDLKVSFVLK